METQIVAFGRKGGNRAPRLRAKTGGPTLIGLIGTRMLLNQALGHALSFRGLQAELWALEKLRQNREPAAEQFR